MLSLCGFVIINIERRSARSTSRKEFRDRFDYIALSVLR